MSNITTDFITATKKIHADIRAILTTLHVIGNDVKAIHDHGDSKGKHGIPAKEHNNIGALHSNQEHVNTYEAKQYALDKLRFGLEKKAFCVGTWTVVILALYTLLTGYQSCQAKRTADATVRAAEAAERQINDTATNFRADQRAWVSIQNMKARFPKSASDNIAVHAEMINVGKSFALNVKSTDTILLSHETRDIADYLQHPDPKVIREAPTGSGSIGSLAPSIPFTINTIWDEPQGVPTAIIQVGRDQFLSAVQQHKQFVYFFGNITYSDVFNQSHYTHFCGVWIPEVDAFQSCPSYNDAN
jgi:hypothetical protein